MLAMPGRRRSREVLFGLWALLTDGLMAGGLLVAMGAARLGRLVEFIPHPVTTGFTAGIATVIATLQLKDVLGLHVARMPDRFPEKVAALWAARGSASLVECGVAAATLALLLLAPRLTRRVPAPLVAIGAVTLAVWALGVPADTLGTRFHTTIDVRDVAGIPPLPPLPRLPWGDTPLTLRLVEKLLPAAFAIAILGAIESLPSAVIAHRMN